VINLPPTWIDTPYGDIWDLSAFRGIVKRTKKNKIEVVGLDFMTGKPTTLMVAADHEEANEMLKLAAGIVSTPRGITFSMN